MSLRTQWRSWCGHVIVFKLSVIPCTLYVSPVCCASSCSWVGPVGSEFDTARSKPQHTAMHMRQSPCDVMQYNAWLFFLILNSLFSPSCCIDYIMSLCNPGEINSSITFVLWKKSKYLIPTVKATAIISCFCFFFLTSCIPTKVIHLMGPNWEKQAPLIIFKYCL